MSESNNRTFNGLRSQLYKEALQQYPEARNMDKEIMELFLDPQSHETILEVGAGSGFFSGKIADQCATLYVSDPSSDQLEEIKNLHKSNIYMLEGGAEELNLPSNTCDKIRNFGAVHHCLDKMQAFQHFERILKPGGKLVLVDVLSGSNLARHFDDKVAKYSLVGHEVSFLSKEYFDSLCFSSGFKNIRTQDLDVQRKFTEEKDVGDFLYKLHAMTKTSIAECLQGAKDILGVTKKDLFYYLDRPLTVFVAEK